MSLEMRTHCEACAATTPPEGEAWICSYECTFCRDCARAGAAPCPNCGGELVARPRRMKKEDQDAPPADR